MLISSSENLLVRRRHGGQCEHGSTANFGFEKCDTLHPRAQVEHVVRWAAKASKAAEAMTRAAQKARLAACVTCPHVCPPRFVRFTLSASLCPLHSARLTLPACLTLSASTLSMRIWLTLLPRCPSTGPAAACGCDHFDAIVS